MNRFIGVLIFLLSIVCFIISVDVFYIQSIFVDEHNFSMGEIFGGNFNLYMVWIRLFLQAVLCILSGIRMFSKKKS